MTFQVDPVFCFIMFLMLCQNISINARLKKLQTEAREDAALATYKYLKDREDAQ